VQGEEGEEHHEVLGGDLGHAQEPKKRKKRAMIRQGGKMKKGRKKRAISRTVTKKKGPKLQKSGREEDSEEGRCLESCASR